MRSRAAEDSSLSAQFVVIPTAPGISHNARAKEVVPDPSRPLARIKRRLLLIDLPTLRARAIRTVHYDNTRIARTNTQRMAAR